MRDPERRQLGPKLKPDDTLEEESEEWVREIPVETFGTEEERGTNYLRLCRELKEEKEKQGIPEEEFKEKLRKAENFAENMPLLHMTDLKSVVEIFESGEMLSTSELRKNRPEGEEFKTMTYRNDENAGLDKFIFFPLCLLTITER